MVNLIQLTFGYEQLSREKIHDNYAWHKKAWDIFSHHEQFKERRGNGPTPFLSRYIQKVTHAEMLLVSKYIPVKPAWCAHDQWHHIEINENYFSQPTYLFDLYANPTRKIKKIEENGKFSKNGRRLTLMDRTSQTEWLCRKGEQHGFQLAEEIPLRIEKPVPHSFLRKGNKGLHIGVRFQGALHVTDGPTFKQTFCAGIGSAKGFGFGLLMIKPVPL